MEQQPHRNPSAAATAPAEPVNPAALAAPPLRGIWTPAKQRIFLAALLETGSVARAARAAGMSRSSAYRLRERLAGTPFDKTWDQVLAHLALRMADPFAPDPGAAPAPRQPQRRPPVAPASPR